MSISQVRNLMEKSGCVTVLLIGLAVVFIGGLWMGQGGQQQPENRAAEQLVFTVGPNKVDLLTYGRAFDAYNTQAMQQMGSLEPLMEFQNYAQAVRETIDDATRLELAKQYGVDTTDEGLMKLAAADLEDGIKRVREQFIKDGKLKKGATDAEFAEVFKKEAQRTLDEAREQTLNPLRDALADPTRRAAALGTIIEPALRKKLAADVKITDAELEKDHTNYVLKKLVLPRTDDAAKDKDVAQKVEAELKAGASIESLMEKYMTVPAPKGQKTSDATETMPLSLIENTPTYAALKDLKVGANTGLVEMPFGFAVYKLIRIDKKLPKDFDQQKEQQREQQAQMKASEELEKKKKELREKLGITWKSPALKVLFEYSDALQNGKFSPQNFQKLEADLKPFLEAAVAAETDPLLRDAAILTQFAISSQLYNNANLQKKKEMQPARVEVLNKVLQARDTVQTRLDLAKILIELKDIAALEQVLAAAQMNTTFEPQAASRNTEIATMIVQLKNAKIGTDDDYKKIQAELDRWNTENQVKIRAEMEMEAERKKAEDELKKEAEKSKLKPVERSELPKGGAPKADAKSAPKTEPQTEPKSK
ncbi:MAG TPA: peptidyl-prolyl cis-trans isomerase [Fimbriimonadaceae bacterium]|nr:peptidyl-prolyl cis-trans isomerase [Fimbriimonadaceae bacterium]